MTGAKNLHTYLSKKDKNGMAVGEWAVQEKDGVARYNWCNTTHKFSKGVYPLHTHSESLSHTSNKPSGMINFPSSLLKRRFSTVKR